MKKRTILVTGGNRGIGLAVVKELAKNVDDTVLMGCRSLREERSNNIIPVKLDLSDRDNLLTQMKNIVETHKSIDVLINNAGISFETDLLSSTPKEMDEIFRVNFFAPYELIKFCLPQMIKNNYGRIVNVTSGLGAFSEGLPGPFSYSVSKAALNAVTLAGSIKLPPSVLINSVTPGWVKTDMGGPDAPRTPGEGAETIAWLANMGDDGPNGKFYRDKEIIEW